MKYLLLFSLCTLPYSSLAAADAPMTLRDHMHALGYLMDEVQSRANSLPQFHEAAAKTRELRQHLTMAISQEPTKFLSMNESERNTARIEFHQLLSRVIYLSASLEKVFDANDDQETQSGTRTEDVRNILHEMNVIIGKAHRKFRD